VAVGVVRRLAKDAYGARLFFPFHDPVVRNVAPQEKAPISEPHWPFRPPEARRQPLDGGQIEPILRKAGIQHLHQRIRISYGFAMPPIHARTSMRKTTIGEITSNAETAERRIAGRRLDQTAGVYHSGFTGPAGGGAPARPNTREGGLHRRGRTRYIALTPIRRGESNERDAQTDAAQGRPDRLDHLQPA